jgi:hypothetical protein
MTNQQAAPTIHHDIRDALDDLRNGRTQTALTETQAQAQGFGPDNIGGEYALVIVGQGYDVWARSHMTRKTRTPNQNPDADSVYNFILGYREGHDGQSPTIRVIMRELGFVTTSTVNERLLQLYRDGDLWRDEDMNLRTDCQNRPVSDADPT